MAPTEERIAVLETEFKNQEIRDKEHDDQIKENNRKINAAFKKADVTEKIVIVMQRDVEAIKKCLDRRQSKNWALILLVIGVIVTGVLNIVFG